jgi:hypothetical protein
LYGGIDERQTFTAGFLKTLLLILTIQRQQGSSKWAAKISGKNRP